jgi:hypothetical protein
MARACADGAFCVLMVLAAAPLQGSPEAVVETASYRFRMAAEGGHYEVLDKETGVTWGSNPQTQRFGHAILTQEGQLVRRMLGACDLRQLGAGWEASFHDSEADSLLGIRVFVRPLWDGRALEFSWEADPGLAVHEIRLLDDAFWVTDAGEGYALVPVREGLRIPATSGKSFERRFGTYDYEGCHLAMFGMVQSGAALLATWDDPYTTLHLRSVLTDAPQTVPRQVLLPSLTLRRPARAVQLHFLGRGDETAVGLAYREVARKRGWLVTWEQKLRENRGRSRLFGASNFKLWSALDRRMSEDSQTEESVRVNWTFDQAAQVAEHLKHDLQLDRVLFQMGGWIRRGYDNQHPDILPAAPECGGNAALANCAERVRALGYLFGLHDNYQDIYRDAPSWNEDLIMKRPDGGLATGGRWAGGRAYLTCSQPALSLARRPQNLPGVQALTQSDTYFIDTTFAAGLQECFDHGHPLTRHDDLFWKQQLAGYARSLFGIFGSECGREWAIPCSDFFEGLTGVSGRLYHEEALLSELAATSVPLFELVYHDTVAAYGKYGYDIDHAADYVLHHVSLGRPLHYHRIPPGLYWQRPAPPGPPPGDGPRPVPDPAQFVRADQGWAEGMHPLDRFIKNTHELLSPLNELTAQLPMTRFEFLTPDLGARLTVFGESAERVSTVVNLSSDKVVLQSALGGEVILPPGGFLVEAPTYVAFCALSWNGRVYAEPVFFTIRSPAGQPLELAARVRVFHGFGDPRLRWLDLNTNVVRELTLTR